MARLVSFAVLLAILIAIGILFYEVVIDFLLPLFLALLLVIIFAPLHRWMLEKCKGRRNLAAALTTGTILVILLLPVALVGLQAIREANGLYDKLEAQKVDMRQLAGHVSDFAARFNVRVSADQLETSMAQGVKEYLAPVALGTVQVVLQTLIGAAIMILAVYFFFADGPKMIVTLMRLSPLDDKYERQLIDQFVDLSRTIVVATLVTAATQGLLAGIGYYFANVSSVFLLTVLTMLLAMVPFVGAVAVWVPVCLWLYFNDQVTAAIVLAIYCGAVVSTIDNVIKPWILHGRARLHPLLGLLGVLGGVRALGPIGIFVGPMVVVFLQTLLNMLRTELEAMSADEVSRAAKSLVQEKQALP